MKIKLVSIIALSTFCISTLAQDTGAPAAIYKPGSEVVTELEAAARASSSAAGVSVTISPGISVRRRSSSVAQYAVLHPYSTEIYRILEGSGTLVIGGLLILPLADSPSEDVVRTEHGVDGGVARHVSEGDILVLQPGTPHWFSSIDGESITYMESRVRITTHPVSYQ